MYDVIVAGARCAGAPLARLLAERGLRVLVVDRSTFPSSVVSTHLIWPPGVAALHRWGVWPAIARCEPAICHISHAFFPGGDLRGPWHAVDGIDYTINLRRRLLDSVLVNAAVAAGAEIREGVRIERLLWDGERVVGAAGVDRRGCTWRETSTLVVGADGRHSTVAKLAGAALDFYVPPLTASYYTLIEESSGDRDVDEIHTHPPREFLFVPTDSGLTIVNLVIARSLLDGFRRRLPSAFYDAFTPHPHLADRLRAGRPAGRIWGAVDLPSFFRRTYGPGWVLVGDAAFHKDPIRAQGINDAFVDAEVLAEAIVDGLSSRRQLETAIQHYVFRRNVRTAFPFELCLRAARFETVPPEQAAAFVDRIKGSPRLIAAFRGLIPGSMQPDEFFGPSYLGGGGVAFGT